MRKVFLIGAMALAVAMPILAAPMMATPAAAAPWVHSYVVEAYEPAWHYGGKVGFTKPGLIDPGVDCTNGTMPELDYDNVLKTKWRSKAEIDDVNRPPNTDGLTIHYLQERALTYRGFRRDINTYVNPFAAPDPGMPQVTGKIAEGFNLDRDYKTGGFTSPDGEKGIDNAYYRAWGCMASFRNLPYHAQMSIRSTDKMLEGLYTMVIRMSGNKDPMNDDAVTLEIGYSPDHAVKGAGSSSAVADYSYRIVKSAEYSKIKATIRNGVVESEQVADLHTPKFSWFPDNTGDANFHQGRVRLILAKDGTLSGLMGGYRDWRDVYTENAFPQSGATQETREHQNMIAMYYALKRNADGMPNPKTGEKMGISIAYRFLAVPAFVLDSPTPIGIYLPANEKKTIDKFKAFSNAFATAISTKTILEAPGGPQTNSLIKRADGSYTNATEGDADAVKGAPPAIAPEPKAKTKDGQQQVSNGAPATLASAAH